MAAERNASLPGRIAILPAYYYLFALYHDYEINNALFARREDAAQMAAFVRRIQTVAPLIQPARKSWALRLFTERQSLARFSPHLVDEAWRQLRQYVAAPSRPVEQPPAAPPRRGRAPRPAAGATHAPAPPPRSRPFPRSPVDYRLTA